METITRKDLLTPFTEFEKSHKITKARDDVPKRFLGRCPSKYYRNVDMNVTKLLAKVAKLFRKLYHKSL